MLRRIEIETKDKVNAYRHHIAGIDHSEKNYQNPDDFKRACTFFAPTVQSFAQLCKFMTDLTVPPISDSVTVQSWFTETGWEKIGKKILEKATEMNLSPKVLKCKDILSPYYQDELQVLREVK